MTEKREFRDFLTSLFKDFILRQAETHLENLDAFRLNLGKGEYRTHEELARIKALLRVRAEEMSIDFLDELNVKGILTPEDYEEKRQILEETLLIYLNKFLKWLQEQ